MLYLIIIAITYIPPHLTVEGHKLDKYVKMNNWLEFGSLDLLGAVSLIGNRCRRLIIAITRLKPVWVFFSREYLPRMLLHSFLSDTYHTRKHYVLLAAEHLQRRFSE